MVLVSKPTWWGNFASYFGFTNDASTTIDSVQIQDTLETYVLGNLGALTNSAFLSTFASVLQPSSSKQTEDNFVVPTTATVNVILGYSGYDYLSGTAGDNILDGGTGNDYFGSSAGVDFIVGSEDVLAFQEKDTMSYMMALSGIVVEATNGGVYVDTGLLPHQDVYSFSLADLNDVFVPKIDDFQMGANGDKLDISALLSSIGYAGTNPIADGYIKLLNATDGLKISFDPDASGSQSAKELVRLMGYTTTADFTTNNLVLQPLVTHTGEDNYLTYVSNDGNGSYDLLYSVENIYGSDFNDVIHGHTVLANVLAGGLGNDTLYGEGGHDTLIGGEGLDTLYGGTGMDLLLIGKGGDQAYGGEGADTFKFDSTIGTNIAANTADIWDFTTGAGGDKIDLAEILKFGGYAGINPIADQVVQIVQDGLNTRISIDFDGIGVQTAQTIAILHNVDSTTFSTANNLVTSAPTTLYISALGQSNAAGLNVLDIDTDSGLTRIRDALDTRSDFDNILLDTKDEYGRILMPAIGSTRVNGDYGGKADDSWWYPSTNKPGEILIRAVEILTIQIAEARAAGAVKPVIVWGQGEGDCVFIGGQTTEEAKLAAQDVYMNATLAVFDYIRAHVGEDVEFYIMETGRYNVQGGLNAGVSQATIDRTVAGIPYIRAAQEEMALLRDDIQIASKYTDLPMYFDTDPVNFPTDSWHFHPETREIIGDRVGEFIALDMGYTHILNNPGDYPLSMLVDLDLKDSAGMTIDGNANNNIVVGTLGNDILTGGAGNDGLYGGAGADEVRYTGVFSNYTLSVSGTWLIITDNVGTDSTDTLIEIERVVFSDGIYENGGFIGGAPNVAPIAQDDIFTANQDTVITGNLMVNNGNGVDSDPDFGALHVVAGTYATAHGSVTITENGNFTYTPTAGYYGADTFDYTLVDNRAGTDIGTVSLTLNQVVAPPNTNPLAKDDVFSGYQNTAITGNLLANNGNGVDSDADGDALTVVAGTYATAHGSVTIASNGNFTYTPTAGYNGVDSFDYTLDDSRGGVDTGSASITLAPTNTIYGTSANNTITGTAAEDTIYGLEGNDTLYGEAGNDVLYGGIGNDTLKGRDGNDTMYGDDGVDYLEGGNGNDIFYGGLGADALKGGSGADKFMYLSAAEGGDTIQDFSVSYAEKIDLTAVLQNVVGFQSANAFTDGYLRIAQNGADTGIYLDMDGTAGGALETLFVTLTNIVSSTITAANFILPVVVVPPVNTPPVAQDDVFTADQDTLVIGNVLANNGNGVDSDVDLNTLNVVAGTYATAHGSVTVLVNGDFTYTPNAGYFGADSFEYTLQDGQGGTDTGLVSLTLNEVVVPPVNTPPVAQDDVFTADQDTLVIGNVLANNGNGVDSDVDLNTLNVVAGTYATAHGSVTISADGGFTYTPNAGYFGADSFEYTLQDGQGGTDTGLVSLTLNEIVVPPVNTPPVAQDDSVNTDEDTAVIIYVLGNDSDADLDPLSVSILTGAAYGSLVVNADKTITYTPNANIHGTDSFTYTINDGRGGSASATVSLNIASINDVPVAANDVFNGAQDANIVGNLLANNGNGLDTDVDLDSLSVVAGTYATTHGSVTISADGGFIYTPTAGYFGADTFDYTLQDGYGGSDIGSVSLTLAAAAPAGIYGTEANNTITGTAANDVIYGLGGNDNLYGEAGSDTLYGGAGNDTLKGRDGNDTMYGGDGVDYLEGGNGDDILIGGLGADTIKGSVGIDTFVFQSMAEAGDIIQDYRPSQGEKLDISDLLVGYDPLTHAISDFVQITDNGVDSVIAIDVDGGANNFVALATLQGVIGITDEEALETSGKLITV